MNDATGAFGDDIVPYPQGAIIVKEEYGEDGADDPAAVTVMEKLSEDNGDWYWMKASADLGRVIEHPEAGPLEGAGEDAPPGCVNCHGAAGDHDYVMLHSGN